MSKSKRAFTLIELLVVIAIIAILSVVVILTLNPAQLLMQAHDANRVSDLANLNSALGIYAEDQGGSFGNASTTYISIPDPSATSSLGDQCQGLGLPSLPTSTTYHCAASSTYRGPNGQGWIPVNFSSISIGSPLAVLPIDPTNTTSSGDYYAYIPGQSSAGTYELIARMESQKYTQSNGGTAANDGGYSNQYDEVGKDLTLALNMPTDLNRVSSTDYLGFDQSGLVGYWPLNEGAGTTAYDRSGNNANATWSGTPVWVSGKVGGYAANISNSNLSVSMPTALGITGPITLSAWIKTTYTGGWAGFISADSGNCGINTRGYLLTISGGYVGGSVASCGVQNANSYIADGNWHLATFTANGTVWSEYLDGGIVGTSTSSFLPGISLPTLYIGTVPSSSIDDIHIYNRALSASEIAAMYNGGM